jgi:hypothetical protein
MIVKAISMSYKVIKVVEEEKKKKSYEQCNHSIQLPTRHYISISYSRYYQKRPTASPYQDMAYLWSPKNASKIWYVKIMTAGFRGGNKIPQMDPRSVAGNQNSTTEIKN